MTAAAPARVLAPHVHPRLRILPPPAALAGNVRAAPRRQQVDAVGRDRLEFPRHSEVTGVAWTLRHHRRVTAGELRRRSTFATKGRLANMSMTKLRWGRVEYQLDLRTPQRPVALGVG